MPPRPNALLALSSLAAASVVGCKGRETPAPAPAPTAAPSPTDADQAAPAAWPKVPSSIARDPAIEARVESILASLSLRQKGFDLRLHCCELVLESGSGLLASS